MDYGSYSSSFVKSRSFVPRGVRAVSQPDIARKEHAPVRAPPSGEGEHQDAQAARSCLGCCGPTRLSEDGRVIVFWSVTVLGRNTSIEKVAAPQDRTHTNPQWLKTCLRRRPASQRAWRRCPSVKGAARRRLPRSSSSARRRRPSPRRRRRAAAPRRAPRARARAPAARTRRAARISRRHRRGRRRSAGRAR